MHRRVSETGSAATGPASPPLLEQTIGDCLEQAARRHAADLALVVKHQGIRWTYEEYLHRVDRLAAGLLAIGLEPGDRVGIWAPNCVEWCLTQFATARIGAIMVCINPAYRLHELEYVLNKAGCRALVTAETFKSSQYLEMLGELAPELAALPPSTALSSTRLPALEFLIRLGEAPTPGMYNFDEVCELGGGQSGAALREACAARSPREAINIQFTSGTTGSPKGATLTHHNILNNGKLVGDGMQLTAADRLCIPVPLYHCFGMVMGNLACVTHGAAAVLPGEAFEPAATLQAVAEEGCTALHGVPTMFIAELECPSFDNYDLSTLRTGIMAGAPCPVEVMKQVIDRMHMADVLIAYGQTELSPVNHMTTVDDPVEKRVSTVGRPAPHLEVKLVDGQGVIVPHGERGEICTRGYSVMMGYWDDEARTGETIDEDGWLHSGDLGVMDEDGYVQVVGRIKDMIIRGGENIYPRELEEFLYSMPEIQEVQVFGIPDERYGEQVCAWVSPREGASLTASAVRDYCSGRIAHYKIPAHVRVVEAFPMTVTGKIQKFRMREQMLEELASLYSKH